jgi:HPt (histidine-containing phosphotransfer) domain-containing protein
MQIFRDSCVEERSRFKMLWDKKELYSLAESAHSMKGGSNTLGAHRLGWMMDRLSVRLEKQGEVSPRFVNSCLGELEETAGAFSRLLSEAGG